MVKEITQFSEIEIIENGLYVFDIDETLIKFDGIDYKWWKNKFNKYYKMTMDHGLSECLSNEEWIKVITKSDPELVDNNIHDFIQILKDKNCHIILLTARSENLKDLTIQHLEKVGLFFENIYFNENKGNALLNILFNQYKNINDIIVVDDMKYNLDDIHEKLSHAGYFSNFHTNLYQIKMT